MSSGDAPSATESSDAAAPSNLDFAVVGIGASAGGLEALTAFLRAIPAHTPLAVMIVQHLARGHDSLLPELLQNVTALTVLQARDGIRIQPHHVYVIPPNTRMTVEDGLLRVQPRPVEAAVDAAVDYFLRSLAEHYAEKAIAVVLSGGANDGAAGVREIKRAGGITFAQDPEEAGIDGMPRAAIATGAIDLVLPVVRIAAEVVRLAEDPRLRGAAVAQLDQKLDEQDHLRRLFQLLRRASGVDFTHYKSPTVMRRIQRRMALHRMDELKPYVDFVQQNPKEAESLYEDVLIHVTSFFREPESFDALRETVFPEILSSRSTDSPIRLWVPGCSSGEEAYSLAIAILEHLGDKGEQVPLQIFGTDVSQKMVDRARAGFYPETAVADLSPERLRRWFVKVDGSYRIGNTVRERCIFARQDITRDPPFSKLSLVVCRNLLIYLGQPLQRKVIEVFHYALRHNGFLMLGRSETTASHADLFSLADKRFKIYRKKPAAIIADMHFRPPVGDPIRQPARQLTASLGDNPPRGDGDIQSEANRLVLGRYSPPGVIVDGSLRIVRTQGRTSPYLELAPGDASLDVLKMAREGLLYGLRSAISEARTSGSTVRKEGLRVAHDGRSRTVNVDVTPLGAPNDRHFLILFEDHGESAAQLPAGPRGERANDDDRPAKKGARRAAGGPADADHLVQRLEEELDANREYLQSIIYDLESANEELQSANEEILSSNEELQSTNEELDTAKEELQSTNEELSTLNDELQGRNEELSRANSDLLNLLVSVHIPIVIVSTDLKIRRFTPAAEKMLNLIAADVGRPIGHIKPNIDCPELEILIREVIDTVTIREREVRDHEDNVFTLRIRPYKNVENRIDGAVLTLFDISAARIQAGLLKEARDYADAIIATVPEPILLLSSELEVLRSNRAFHRRFATSPTETDGHFLPELDGGRWNLPPLRNLLDEVISQHKNFEEFAVEQDFPRVGRRKLLIDARRIDSAKVGTSSIVLVIRDVTDREG